MSFIRPELEEKIIRWQEPLIHSGFVVVELLVLRSAVAKLNIPLQILCVFLIVISVGLMIVSIRKTRLRGVGTIQGHVEVDERQITYFTAGDGWSVSINDLMRVHLISAEVPEADMTWVFKDVFGTKLTIPSSAKNVDGVFDALAALKGVDYDAITNASTSSGSVIFTIWTKQQ